MEEQFIVDGIIDVIKELQEAAKCPFCQRNLKIRSASTSSSYRGEVFTLRCKHCKLDFTIKKAEDGKWKVQEVEARSW